MNHRPVLLLGASGMLGSRFAAHLAGRPLALVPREALDVTRPRHLVDAIVATSAATIVNCVADTDVEGAEAEPSRAFAVNALLPGLLAQAAREMDALLVHFSSTGCYGRAAGGGLAPHSDFSPLHPTTVHHKSKAAGEAAILEAGCRHLVLRLGWLYGGSMGHRRNFVWARILEARQKPELFSDPHQIGSPTDVEDVVRQTLLLVDERMTGSFNCVASGAVSRFDYVRHILASAGLSPVLVPKRFDRRAPVSPNEAAVNDKLTLLGLNRMPAWDAAVTAYVEALLAEEGRSADVR
ncbi:SDR family oxidoreductase [Shinella sp. BYT-45]|uniref:SDR family oxidoreductase n=1 Tax=Shinella sp. BYT-45 TaxID=3377377 RepID=UPI00397F9836